MRANNHFREDSRGVLGFPRSHLDYGIFDKNVHVGYRGLIKTAETDPAVSLRQRNPNCKQVSQISQ
jgi:hypothetical protein